MTYSRAELFAQDQLRLALEHSVAGEVAIHGSDTKVWRERFFISPTEAVKAANALEEDCEVTLKRLPGLVVVRRRAGK